MNTFYMVFVEGCATPACKGVLPQLANMTAWIVRKKKRKGLQLF